MSARRPILRTENERDADQFDCRLYALIEKAEQHSAEALTVEDRSRWSIVAGSLRQARGRLREMVNERDRPAVDEGDRYLAGNDVDSLIGGVLRQQGRLP